MHKISADAAALLQKGATFILEHFDLFIVELDAAVLDSVQLPDTELQRLIYSANRMNVRHWTQQTLAAPHQPVPANLSPELQQITREQARLGIDQLAEKAYRVGQHVAWTNWMQVLFQMSDDKDILKEALSFSSRSINNFVDVTLEGLRRQIEREQMMLTQSRHAQRRQLVFDFLEGRATHPATVGQQLSYRLDRTHCAHIIWSRSDAADTAHIEDVAQSLIEMAGSRDALMIMVDPETCWLWLPKSLPDNVLSAQSGPEIRIAVGAPLAGPEGFKRSLKQAQTTRRILSDANPEYAMARYDTIRSVATFTADPSARARYALECLGALLDAPPPLRRALRIYLREGSNAAETAKALGIHRNTLSQQLARAQDLLPSALNGETRLDVMMALELDHWTNHTPH